MRIDTPRVLERRKSLVRLLGRFLVTACAALCLQALAGDSLREHLSLDAGWKFHRLALLKPAPAALPSSPDGHLALAVSDDAGLRYRVERDGKPLLADSVLGLAT